MQGLFFVGSYPALIVTLDYYNRRFPGITMRALIDRIREGL